VSARVEFGLMHFKRAPRRYRSVCLVARRSKRLSHRALGVERRGLASVAPPKVVWEHIRFAFRGRIWHPEQVDLAQMGGDFVFDRVGNLTLRHIGPPPTTGCVSSS